MKHCKFGILHGAALQRYSTCKQKPFSVSGVKCRSGMPASLSSFWPSSMWRRSWASCCAASISLCRCCCLALDSACRRSASCMQCSVRQVRSDDTQPAVYSIACGPALDARKDVQSAVYILACGPALFTEMRHLADRLDKHAISPAPTLQQRQV